MFWDSLKPKAKTFSATHVEVLNDGTELSFTWSDGLVTHASARRLRQLCPCAECVEEWSGKRVVVADKIPEGLKVVEANGVGNYALGFTFGDLHRTGIFNWEYLRDITSPPSTIP